MSPAKDVASAITRFIDAKRKDAPTQVPDVLPEQDDAVAVLVQSFLLWQSTTEKAAAAYEKIRKSFVDWNDLRVSMPDEVAVVIGVRYPEVDERCRRLRAVLRNLYQREHEMSFASAEAAGKRSLRKYLESLEGMLPYVAERTLLVAFGGHGVPVDETLRLHLQDEGIVDDEMDDAEASSLLLKHVKAADALSAHLALQAWTDQAGPPRSARKPSPAKAGGSTTTRKTSSRKASSRKKTTSASGAGTSSKTTSRTTSKTTSKKTSKSPSNSSAKSGAKKTTKKTSSAKTASRKTTTKKSSRKRTTRSTSA